MKNKFNYFVEDEFFRNLYMKNIVDKTSEDYLDKIEEIDQKIKNYERLLKSLEWVVLHKDHLMFNEVEKKLWVNGNVYDYRDLVSYTFYDDTYQYKQLVKYEDRSKYKLSALGYMAGSNFSESIILSILFGKYKEKIYVKNKDMIVNSYIGIDLSFTNGSETIVLNDKTTNSKLTISTLKMQLESILMVLKSVQNDPEPDNDKVMKKRKRIDDTNKLINDLGQQKDDLTKNGPLYVIDKEYRNSELNHLSDREYLNYLYDNRLIDKDLKNVKKTNKILFWIWFGFSFLFIISPINWMANDLIDSATSCAVLILGVFLNPFVFKPFIRGIRNLILYIIVCKQDG